MSNGRAEEIIRFGLRCDLGEHRRERVARVVCAKRLEIEEELFEVLTRFGGVG